MIILYLRYYDNGTLRLDNRQDVRVARDRAFVFRILQRFSQRLSPYETSPPFDALRAGSGLSTRLLAQPFETCYKRLGGYGIRHKDRASNQARDDFLMAQHY